MGCLSCSPLKTAFMGNAIALGVWQVVAATRLGLLVQAGEAYVSYLIPACRLMVSGYFSWGLCQMKTKQDHIFQSATCGLLLTYCMLLPAIYHKWLRLPRVVHYLALYLYFKTPFHDAYNISFCFLLIMLSFEGIGSQRWWCS